MPATTLPIFPLNAVLFPEGVLPLRIFETRYIDMVTACLRDETDFGVCLIKKGQEIGAPADPEEIGCRARILDWSMEQLGLLHIRTVGTERFRIRNVEAGPEGLLRAEVAPLEIEEPAAVPHELEACTQLLKRIIEQLTKQLPSADPEEKLPISEPFRLDDAGWVSNRLCEFLPISLPAKQKLMELTDAPTRLSLVHQYLQQQKIVK